jgi:hypothetical protein
MGGLWAHANAAACTACVAGKFSVASGAASAAGCADCGAGRYSSDEAAAGCISCPVGRHTGANATGAASYAACLQCEAGRFNPAVARAECQPCPKGQYQGSAGATTCIECPVGQYLDLEGAAAEAVCKNCPAGTLTYLPGKQSATECTGCTAGKFNSSMGDCASCPVGRYSTSESASSASGCLDCFAGTHMQAEGAASCESCPSGQFSGPGFRHCVLCSTNAGCPAGPTGEQCTGAQFGSCYYGFCSCEEGFGGDDCSVGSCTTCAGVFEVEGASRKLAGYKHSVFSITVSRRAGNAGAAAASITVVADGNATAGVDYEDGGAGAGGTWPLVVEFAPGEISKQVVVPTLEDPAMDRGCRLLSLAITGATGGASVGVHNTSRIYMAETAFASRLLSSADSAGLEPSAAELLLGPAQTFTQTVNVTVPTTLPVDLVLLYDMSGSFADDITSLQKPTGIRNLVTTLKDNYGTQTRLGLASFIDKPVIPFGITEGRMQPAAHSDVYEFRVHQQLTANGNEMALASGQLSCDASALFGGDAPEGQLQALLQVVDSAQVGWASDSTYAHRRVVVLSTDNTYHKAGDYVSRTVNGTAVPVAANDGDAVGAGDPPGSAEDYPAVAQVKAALARANVAVVFAVTADQLENYRALGEQLGSAVVVTLESDSTNIEAAIDSALSTLSTEVQLQVNDDPYGYVQDISPALFTSVSPGSEVQFTVTFNVTQTASELVSTRSAGTTVKLNVVGFDTVTYDVKHALAACNVPPYVAAGGEGSDGADFKSSGYFRPATEDVWELTDTNTTQVASDEVSSASFVVDHGAQQKVSRVKTNIAFAHDNQIPFVFRLTAKVAATSTVELVATHADGSQTTVANIVVSGAISNWQNKFEVIFPLKVIKTLSLNVEYDGQGKGEFKNFGLFQFPTTGCMCGPGFYGSPKYLKNERTMMSVAACTKAPENCTECTRCFAGHSCGGALLTRCGPGTFAFGGATECSPCPDGWVCQNGVGSPCLGNTFASDSSAETCQVCTAGHKVMYTTRDCSTKKFLFVCVPFNANSSTDLSGCRCSATMGGSQLALPGSTAHRTPTCAFFVLPENIQLHRQRIAATALLER